MAVKAGTPARRFSLASLVAVAFAASALAGAPDAAAQESVAASCAPRDATTPVAAPADRFGQTFTAALSGTLTRVEIEFDSSGDQEWVVEIRTVDGATGQPTGVILASTTIGLPVAPVFTRESVAFANPPTVAAGQRYALVVGRPGAATGTWRLGANVPATECAGDLWRSRDGGATWEAFPLGTDMVFSAFVTPPVAPGAQATCKGKAATHVGTAGDDELSGTPGPDVIVALGGDDRIKAHGGKDLVCAGDGADIVKGANGADRLFGEAGDDRAFGGAGKDALRGGSGDDGLYGRGNRDHIKGNAGNDKLGGGGGRDTLRGNKGRDRLFGQGGEDSCKGGSGRDKEKSC